ncbi:MAG: double zinc ribbon domain-containing protein [Gemmatimonadota bacterium]
MRALERRTFAARRILSATGAALDRLLPPGCAGCGAPVPPGPPLCGVCDAALGEIPRPWCRRCGATATSPLDAEDCDACSAWPDGLKQKRAASAVLFEEPGDRLVAGLKYRGWSALAPAMAARMLEPARRVVAGRRPFLLAVPLDRRRERQRGFNQALLLARELSARLEWPLATGLVRRPVRRRQAELGREEREANVARAYSWDETLRPPPRPVLLVDDVLTTGATAAACSNAIEAAGGACLGIVTFARALPRPDEI